MEIPITFKTPDVVEDTLNEIENEDDRELAKQLVEKWVRDGEYITVIVNTTDEQCYVKEAT